MIDRRLLDDAYKIVTGDRNVAYGTPEANLGRTAALWSAYLGLGLTAADVSKMMVLMKLSRSRHRYKRDDYLDGIGYLAIAEGLDNGISE